MTEIRGSNARSVWAAAKETQRGRPDLTYNIGRSSPLTARFDDFDYAWEDDIERAKKEN
jgi:hypothetical protein